MTSKLQAITKGSQIIDQIFWELLIILKSSKPQTEISLANKIRVLAKRLGAQGMAFAPIVSFGASSAEIHHFPTKKRIGKNNFLMLDFGVKVAGFCSDFTRTLFIGKPTKHQEKIYNIVLKAQLAAIKKVKINAKAKIIDRAARAIIESAGFAKFYTHGTGHGVGKQIHEAPSFKPNSEQSVPKNSIVTIEPGIYLPKKFGVRIEDMILPAREHDARAMPEQAHVRSLGEGGVSEKPKIFSKIPKDFESMIVDSSK